MLFLAMNSILPRFKRITFIGISILFCATCQANTAEQTTINDIKIPPVDNSFELPAIGWWVISILIISGIAFSLYLLWQAHKKQHVRRVAKTALRAIDCQHPDALKQINQIIKQTCLYYFPREFVAALSGKLWQQFLQTHQKKHQTDILWFQLQYQPFDATKHPAVSAQYKQFAVDFLSQSFPPKVQHSKNSHNQTKNALESSHA